jgi:DNA-binding SARP family transcriptional activator/predicted ATPase
MISVGLQPIAQRAPPGCASLRRGSNGKMAQARSCPQEPATWCAGYAVRRQDKPEGAKQAVELRVGGAAKVCVGQREIKLERKAAALLAYAALEREVPRGMAAAMLWPDADEKAARNSLRQLLFKLRNSLGMELIVGGDILRLAGGTVVDAHAPETMAGALLEGWEYQDCSQFDEWLTAARERIAQQHRKALGERAAALEDAGRVDEALAVALETLRGDPLAEAAHRRAIRLYYLSGDRAAALASYERCVTALRQGLGVEPSAETRALAASIGTEQAVTKRPGPTEVPVTVLRPPRMVGRDRELQALLRTWRDGRVFLVLGEPGMGKSRLLAEFRSESEHVACAAARPGDGGIPYASLARLLRVVIEAWPRAADAASRDELARVLPEIGEAGARSAEGQRLALHRAVLSVLERARSDGLRGAILDDLHFADAASVEMLQALTVDDALSDLRWGYSQRQAEGDPAAMVLRDALIDANQLELVELEPLTEAQMTALVNSLGVPQLQDAGLGVWLTRHCGGNPLFALETLKEALATGRPLGEGQLPAPVSVGALITRRLKQLSAGALALARVAALAGSDFSAALAEHVLQTPALALADAWGELEAAQVLRGEAFAHDLIYEATRRSVPEAIARHTHRAIAEYLEGRPSEPARLAEHWLAAGDAARTVPHLHAAARRAEAAARFAESRSLIERAIALAEASGQRRDALQMQFLLIDLMRERASGEEKMALLDRMQANAESADEKLRICFSQTFVLAELDQPARAIETAQGMLSDPDLIDEGTPLRVVELRLALASVLRVVGRSEEALEQLQLIELPMREHADLQFRGWFHSDYARALFYTGQLALAEQQFVAALQMAREVGRKRMIAGVLQVAANIAQAAGRVQETCDRLQEAQLLVADSPDSTFAWFLGNSLADALCYLGRYRESIAARDAALAQKDTVNAGWARSALTGEALVWAQLGQPQRAQRSLARAGSLAIDAANRRQRLFFDLHRLQIVWLQGDPTDEVMRVCEESATSVNEEAYRWAVTLMRILIAPSPEDARSARDIGSAASATGHMGHTLIAHLAAGLACRRQGDSREVVTEVAAALKLMHRFTLPVVYRGAQWWLAYEAARDVAETLARQALREGVDWINTVARYHVPEPFRDSFLNRNRFNRALLAAAMAGSTR